MVLTIPLLSGDLQKTKSTKILGKRRIGYIIVFAELVDGFGLCEDKQGKKIPISDTTQALKAIFLFPAVRLSQKAFATCLDHRLPDSL
jgi:hypothetical protein